MRRRALVHCLVGVFAAAIASIAAVRIGKPPSPGVAKENSKSPQKPDPSAVVAKGVKKSRTRATLQGHSKNGAGSMKGPKPVKLQPSQKRSKKATGTKKSLRTSRNHSSKSKSRGAKVKTMKAKRPTTKKAKDKAKIWRHVAAVGAKKTGKNPYNSLTTEEKKMWSTSMIGATDKAVRLLMPKNGKVN